jgi:putative ABC transport system permease protein
MNIFRQISAVVAMNVRGIPRRIGMSLAMIFASAVVVAILLAFLAMAKGFEMTLQGAGSDDVAIVLRAGSKSEINSVLSRDQVNLISHAPGIALKDGEAILSPELYVIVDGTKRSSGTEANIPLRGLSQDGIGLRSQFHLVQGRLFRPGTREIIVGQAVNDEFSGFDLGQTIRFGKNEWTVVGLFAANGSVYESELWADISTVQSAYRRGSSVQTIRARLSGPDGLQQLQAYIDREPRLNVEAKTEREYFSQEGQQLRYMAIFGYVVSAIMALGAISGALNTMYTSVAQKSREIATLRALGFHGFSAFCGTLVEAVSLALIGGLAGATAAWLLFDNMTASTLGASFTQVVFRFQLTGDALLQGVLIAIAIGLVSGFFPAWRAARIPITRAFQE